MGLSQVYEGRLLRGSMGLPDHCQGTSQPVSLSEAPEHSTQVGYITHFSDWAPSAKLFRLLGLGQHYTGGCMREGQLLHVTERPLDLRVKLI